MMPRRDDLLRLLELLDVTEVEEIDCEEFLHRVAAFAERLHDGAVPPPGYEKVAQHLKVCPECLEEYESLYRTLRGE